MVQRSWEDANGKANVICCRWIKRFNFQNCIHHIHSIEWWLNNIRQLLCAVCMHRCCYHMWNVSYVLTWFLLKKNTHTPFFLHFSPDMPHSKFHFLLLIPAAPLPLSFRVKSHTFIKRKEKMNTYHGKRFHTPYEQVNMFYLNSFIAIPHRNQYLSTFIDSKYPEMHEIKVNRSWVIVDMTTNIDSNNF